MNPPPTKCRCYLYYITGRGLEQPSRPAWHLAQRHAHTHTTLSQLVWKRTERTHKHTVTKKKETNKHLESAHLHTTLRFSSAKNTHNSTVPRRIQHRAYYEELFTRNHDPSILTLTLNFSRNCSLSFFAASSCFCFSPQ